MGSAPVWSAIRAGQGFARRMGRRENILLNLIDFVKGVLAEPHPWRAGKTRSNGTGAPHNPAGHAVRAGLRRVAEGDQRQDGSGGFKLFLPRNPAPGNHTLPATKITAGVQPTVIFKTFVYPGFDPGPGIDPGPSDDNTIVRDVLALGFNNCPARETRAGQMSVGQGRRPPEAVSGRFPPGQGWFTP